MRKFNIFTVFLAAVILALSLASPTVTAISNPNIAADVALLVELRSGRILYEQDKDKRVAPGSIAKIMTLLLAVLEIEKGQVSLKDNVTASKTFLFGISENAATMKIKPGETMRYGDLMYGAYIASANDACNILAEEISGSISDFVSKMNEKAEELGCRNTRFMNPGGLNDPGQYTTAWDQYLIFREAVGHPLFLKIAGTVSYTTAVDSDSPIRSFLNPNLLLREQSSFYDECCVAGKTASSSDYGNSLVSYAQNKELSLISVVFGVKPAGGGSNASAAARCLTEVKRLCEWAMTGFTWHDVVKQHEIVTNEKIVLAKGTGRINIRTSEPVTILARSDLTPADIKKDIVIHGQAEGKVLSAPVKKGDILGEMTISIDGEVRGKVTLAAAQNVALDKGAFIKSHIAGTLTIFWVQLVLVLVIAFVGLYIWLVIRDHKIRCEERRRLAEVKKRLIMERQNQITKNKKEGVSR